MILVIELGFIFVYAFDLTGETIVSPGARQGLIPLAIPLTKNSSGMGLGLTSYVP